MKEMSYVPDDKNYTDPSQSGVDSSVKRAGDLTNEPPVNEATNKTTASKLANLLGSQVPSHKRRDFGSYKQKITFHGQQD